MFVILSFLKVAIIVAALGVIPLGLSAWRYKYKRYFLVRAATAFSLASCIVAFVSFYLHPPALYEPWWGEAGLTVWVLWWASALISAFTTSKWLKEIRLPLALTGVGLASAILQVSELINAESYGQLLGSVDRRVWTEDIQPKSVEHVQTNSDENAAYMANQALGQAGSMGSQFQVSRPVTQQKIGGAFYYVVPLDHVSWSTWWNTVSVPAYILVSGQDPFEPARLVTGQRLKYTPSAYLNNNLARHLWAHGYASTGLIEFVPEVDERDKLWYVVTTFEYAINGWAGMRTTGVLLIDPVTGQITQRRMGEIDQWVDRVIPPDIVQQNIRYAGLYPKGDYWNTVPLLMGARQGLTEPEESELVFGADNDLYWVTGTTPLGNPASSLAGLYYTNTRTGRTTFYEASGSIDRAIVAAINKHSAVQYRQLHGVRPQIYNIAGAMTAIVPMMNENHAYQGLGFVNVKNLQVMAFGTTAQEAYDTYIALLDTPTAGPNPDFERQIESLTGRVDRFTAETTGNATVYYIHIEGVPHIFSASGTLSNKLRLTRAGDRVYIAFISSGAEVEPLREFDNRSLTVERSRTPK